MKEEPFGHAAGAQPGSGTPRAWALAGVFLIAAVAVLWFAKFPGILVGDDAAFINAVQHGHSPSTIFQALTTTSAEKYRPLLSLAFLLVVPAFGTNFAAYESLNVVIEIVNALLVAAIVMRLTRGRGLLALAAALAFVVSRFAYYNVMQVIGLMEGLALLFTLLAMRAAADAFVLDRYGRLTWAVLWYALAVFTDERFLVVGLFVVACAVLHPRASSQPRTRAAVAGGALLVLALYVGVKKLLFHEHLLVGTGGTLVATDAGTVLRFAGAAMANFFGFNVGPDFLSGLDLAEAGVPGYLLGLLVAVPAAALIGAFVYAAVRRRDRKALRDGVLGLALFLPLALSATVTFRQEFRWLYAADTVFLIGLAAIAARLEPQRLAVAAAVGAFVASAGGSLWYRQFVENVFFMGGMNVASQVRDAIAQDPADPVFIVHHGDKSIEKWVFSHGAFFSLYGIARPPVTFVTDVAQARGASPDILSVRWPNVVRVPLSVARAVPVVPFPRSALSFIDTFPTGSISDPKFVETPNHHGALILKWPSPGGLVAALTVVDTFRYRYPPARVAPGMALAFYAARPTAQGDPTRAFVTVTDGAKSTVVFDENLVPAGKDAIAWKRHVIDLRRFAGRNVVFTFGADATEDPAGAWAAFAYPALVIDKPLVKHLVSVCVPAYNEGEVVDELARRLAAVADMLAAEYDFEFIICENGSRDDTYAKLLAARERDGRIKIVRLSRNFLSEGGVTAALAHARGDCAVIMSADLQDPPEYIPRLLEKWREGYENVYCIVRSKRTGESACADSSRTRYYGLMNWVSESPAPRDVSDFPARRSRRVRDVLADAGTIPRDALMWSWMGFRSIGIVTERPARAGGTSKFRFFGRCFDAMRHVFAQSRAPLVVMPAFGLGARRAVVRAARREHRPRVRVRGAVRRFRHDRRAGAAAVRVSFVFLWMIAEYIGLIFEQVRHRPTFIVAQTHGLDDREPLGSLDRRAAAPRRRARRSTEGLDLQFTPGRRCASRLDDRACDEVDLVVAQSRKRPDPEHVVHDDVGVASGRRRRGRRRSHMRAGARGFRRRPAACRSCGR